MGEPIPMKQKPKTLDQLADELEAMLRPMAQALVDHPEDVIVHRAVSPSGFIAFEVVCRESDAGTLVGRRGSLADAMRLLLTSAAAARKIRATVQFMSDQNDRMPRR
jgi:predicted RNA-binding protein YlqC (UPF0109 family)